MHAVGFRVCAQGACGHGAADVTYVLRHGRGTVCEAQMFRGVQEVFARQRQSLGERVWS